MSTRFAALWTGGAAVMLAAIAVRAFTIPSQACWEGFNPAGLDAAKVAAVVIAGLLVVPGWGLLIAVDPPRSGVRLLLALTLISELAAAIALFYYLRSLPTYNCG